MLLTNLLVCHSSHSRLLTVLAQVGMNRLGVTLHPHCRCDPALLPHSRSTHLAMTSHISRLAGGSVRRGAKSSATTRSQGAARAARVSTRPRRAEPTYVRGHQGMAGDNSYNKGAA
jgi:hypothetical protein